MLRTNFQTPVYAHCITSIARTQKSHRDGSCRLTGPVFARPAQERKPGYYESSDHRVHAEARPTQARPTPGHRWRVPELIRVSRKIGPEARYPLIRASRP